jgi:glycosyltransferase involved in cell wall biosynthesis
MRVEAKVSCIIPFYNEGYRIFQVLEVVTKLQCINEIICVDDGSADHTWRKIKEIWRQVKVVRLPRNSGKAAAIRYGLDYVTNDAVLLMDADLQEINKEELQSAVQAFCNSGDLDMLILRRTNASWFVKMERGDVLLSGERVLKKQDLYNILNQGVDRYQLEVAINRYMQKNKRKVMWVAWSATNTYKIDKLGMMKGSRKELKMYADIIQYLGLMNMLKQIMSFARKELKC